MSKIEVFEQSIRGGIPIRDIDADLRRDLFGDEKYSMDGYVRYDDLLSYRLKKLEKSLQTDSNYINDLNVSIFKSLEIGEPIASLPEEEINTFGRRVSDVVARFGGSWAFILLFMSLILIWVGINTFHFFTDHFDPYPFIFFNLVLAIITALQAPLILMSQNRQADRDRNKADVDYKTTLKAELEIRILHDKIDHLLKILEILIEMVDDVKHKVDETE